MSHRCCICDKPIPKKLIPKEALQKIGLQFFWHDECAEKQNLK